MKRFNIEFRVEYQSDLPQQEVATRLALVVQAWAAQNPSLGVESVESNTHFFASGKVFKKEKE